MKPLTRCAWTGIDPLMIAYHDREWGVPLHEDQKAVRISLSGGGTGRSELVNRSE